MIADRQTHRQTDTLVALLRAALSEKQSNGTTFEILWLHIARSAADEDHQRAVVDWKRRPGRPNHTWLRATETTEHRSFLGVEEGSLSRTLAFDCGHGYAQEESMP